MERIVEKGHGISPDVPEKGIQSSPSHTLRGAGVLQITGSGELVIQELEITAASLHSVLVHPWYSHVSPDNHFSYQVLPLTLLPVLSRDLRYADILKTFLRVEMWLSFSPLVIGLMN